MVLSPESLKQWQLKKALVEAAFERQAGPSAGCLSAAHQGFHVVFLKSRALMSLAAPRLYGGTHWEWGGGRDNIVCTTWGLSACVWKESTFTPCCAPRGSCVAMGWWGGLGLKTLALFPLCTLSNRNLPLKTCGPNGEAVASRGRWALFATPVPCSASTISLPTQYGVLGGPK